MIKAIELNIIYNYYIIFRLSSMIETKTTIDTPTTESQDYSRMTIRLQFYLGRQIVLMVDLVEY